ncbi:MAG: MFS transporter [Legionellales bacterium]|nr:MFS transporter [Legionellales bacterium]
MLLKQTTEVNAWQSWLVVLIASLFFCYEFMQISMFNALGEALMTAFHISPAEYGHLSGFYFYGNLLFLIPAGLILDRCSTRKVLCWVSGVCALATWVFSNAQAIEWAEAARWVTGLGGAFAFLVVIRLATRWFSTDRLAFVVGVVVTLAMFGGMIAQTPFVWMTEHLGWRQTLYYDSILGFIITGLIALWVKDTPQHMHWVEESSVTYAQIKHTLTLAFKNTQNWLGGVIISLLNLPIFIFGATWGGLYLIQVHHMTTYQASFITSMIFVGMIVGSPLIGWWSDHYAFNIQQGRLACIQGGSRRQPLLVSSVASFVTIMILIFSHALSFESLMGLFFLMGLFCSMHVVGYPLVAESNPPELTASASAISSMLIMAGGFILPIFGWGMSLMGDVHMIGHTAIYSSLDYQIGMSILPLAYILAGWAAYSVKETLSCQSVNDLKAVCNEDSISSQA